jgi:hypothetical protein
MSEPTSLRQDRWADFPKYSYSLFTDDFLRRLLNFKFKMESPRSSARVRYATRNGSVPVQLDYEASMLWKIGGEEALMARVKSSDYLKLHYDHGLLEQGGRQWNFYGSLNVTRALRGASVRVGAHLIGDSLQTDNRLKVELQNKPEGRVTWYNRSVASSGKFRFGFLGAYSLSNNFFVKNNCLLGYQLGSRTSFFWRVENDQYRKHPQELGSLFDWSYLDFVSSYGHHLKYGLEVPMGLLSWPTRSRG